MIPKKHCILNAVYQGKGRNFKVARWNGEEFRGMRTKFGAVFEDGELHWEEGAPFGTFNPHKLKQTIIEDNCVYWWNGRIYELKGELMPEVTKNKP